MNNETAFTICMVVLVVLSGLAGALLMGWALKGPKR